MVIIPGQRAEPYRFTCEQCAEPVESYRTGRQLPRFCGRDCRDAARRLGNVNRYPQAGHWMLRWNDRGRKVHIWEHRHVWQQANGPIPRGYIVHHKDGDGFNNELGNLELVTRAEHAAHHQPLGTYAKRGRTFANLERRLRELEAELAACRESSGRT